MSTSDTESGTTGEGGVARYSPGIPGWLSALGIALLAYILPKDIPTPWKVGLSVSVLLLCVLLALGIWWWKRKARGAKALVFILVFMFLNAGSGTAGHYLATVLPLRRDQSREEGSPPVVPVDPPVVPIGPPIPGPREEAQPCAIDLLAPSENPAVVDTGAQIRAVTRNFELSDERDIVALMDMTRDVLPFAAVTAHQFQLPLENCLVGLFGMSYVGKHVLLLRAPEHDCQTKLFFSVRMSEAFIGEKKDIFEDIHNTWKMTDGHLHCRGKRRSTERPAIAKFRWKLVDPRDLVIELLVRFPDRSRIGGLNVSVPPYGIEIGDGDALVFAIKRTKTRNTLAAPSPPLATPSDVLLPLPATDIGVRQRTPCKLEAGEWINVRIEFRLRHRRQCQDVHVLVNGDSVIWWRDLMPQVDAVPTAVSIIAWRNAIFEIDYLTAVSPFWDDCGA